MKLPCFASHSVIAVLLSVCRVSALTVRGSVGQEVTLPCRYSVRDLGVTTMCWGRGELPLSGCNNMIISTDGQSVNSRLSERYQLLGQLTGGDVSLTILHAQESDSGLYGCRVEIPGWFNDQKHTVNLIVTKASVTTTNSLVPSSVTPEPRTSAATTQTPSKSTGKAADSTISSTMSSAQLSSSAYSNSAGGPVLTIGLVAVLALVLVLLTLLFLLLRRRQRRAKTTTRLDPQVIPELQTRARVEENIYSIDPQDDYEVCP
ncbi:hepatitis A virus cellular receptor 1 homolog isoform X6 [Lepisosteus oculatus]|uniref:hepatitis A virus cellular receptor 1 homolog isoform X6 n=1 Tax=Lepisosteus oculatus TaxID=7918 RepID=UPI0035F51E9F